MTTSAHGTAEKGFETPENQVDFYRRMIDFTTDVISKHSPEGVFLFVSQACRDLLGYDPEDLVGHDSYNFHHIDDITDVRVSHREILKAPIVYTVAYRFRHKKGHYVSVETTSKTVNDPQTGHVEFIICTTRDITLRKKAEAALARRLEMERVISGISIEFLGLESGDLDQGIRRALATIGTICRADRAYVFMFREGGRLADNTHEWCAPGVEPQMDKLQGICIPEELPWFARSVQKHEIFQVTDLVVCPISAKARNIPGDRSLRTAAGSPPGAGPLRRTGHPLPHHGPHDAGQRTAGIYRIRYGTGPPDLDRRPNSDPAALR